MTGWPLVELVVLERKEIAMSTPIARVRLSLEAALEEAGAAVRIAGGNELSPQARDRILRSARGEITDEEYLTEVLAAVKR